MAITRRQFLGAGAAAALTPALARAMEEAVDCCAPARDAEDGGAAATNSEAARPREEPPEGMQALPGGTFTMGTDDNIGYPADGEGPAREVRVAPFHMDIHAVSNERFAAFVEDTGYETEAERFGWTFVFHHFVPEDIRETGLRVQNAPWWVQVHGAYWRRPEGPDSDLSGRMDHPAVHISWNDAVAYCDWAGKRLPTEAEFEYAARGGREQTLYPWGDELTPDGEHRCNIWQGRFPVENTAEDGYAGTAPVDAFPPNGFGLYNMAGNVWEWCADWFSPDYHVDGPRDNPSGPPNGAAKVMRGGSYLCHASYCHRYRLSARSSNTPDSSTGNLGFRCAADAR